MFIGHYAVGFAAKKAAPKTSLGALFLAVSFLDLIWPIFLLLGWEEVDILQNVREYTPLYFSNYPISHSLLTSIGWALLLAGGYYMFTKYRTGAIWVAVAVVSHWILDFVSHRPDLPLMPRSDARYGLGLWNSKRNTLLVEGSMFLIGMAIYLSMTKKKSMAGMISLWSFVLLLFAIYAGTFIGPPPPNAHVLALMGLSGWLIPLWGYWIERTRTIA